ncbi:MAG: hypothetical protein U5L45_16020 [Saprospiraceae bacterium]|nr:hypothetical protein [Saprospiraceae bacterium]
MVHFSAKPKNEPHLRPLRERSERKVLNIPHFSCTFIALKRKNRLFYW